MDLNEQLAGARRERRICARALELAASHLETSLEVAAGGHPQLMTSFADLVLARAALDERINDLEQRLLEASVVRSRLDEAIIPNSQRRFIPVGDIA